MAEAETWRTLAIDVLLVRAAPDANVALSSVMERIAARLKAEAQGKSQATPTVPPSSEGVKITVTSAPSEPTGMERVAYTQQRIGRTWSEEAKARAAEKRAARKAAQEPQSLSSEPVEPVEERETAIAEDGAYAGLTLDERQDLATEELRDLLTEENDMITVGHLSDIASKYNLSMSCVERLMNSLPPIHVGKR